ncbi:aromatic acid exporter family protein [Gracilibacillus caseinilyticus]|uniref:Aromatic acid exporter family protein n=1 Tax=Gracilibacillus caseinilyticus TaxID=2932256 RepID=A0ABY4F1P1_9BACI|nr:aromatic acid exporter family protein [Gracilibacillus caseinilyticus]UOQ48326.1 aromatic acid exporter family protein [Gracilibacillus caseinilyticus]
MKLSKLRYRLFGRRVIKTALAVFLTSLICDWMGWPPVFAVITAIVTIEPTVADSIKKGIIRFPASAIGSGYAVLFISLFGNTPITYTLAALFTIITCYRLGLHAGLLVATLTSVAMIEVIHTNLFVAFAIRLGTTTIGLSVSTLVNMFILPPNYTRKILTNMHDLLKQTGEELEIILKQLLGNGELTNQKQEIDQRFQTLKNMLDQTERLLNFQSAESRYHRLDDRTKSVFDYERKNLTRLRLIHYHIGNLINTPIQHVCWSKHECEDIVLMVETLADFMKNPDHYKASAYKKQVKTLMNQFWESKKPSEEDDPTLFTPEVIILYELLSIYNIVENIILSEREITES